METSGCPRNRHSGPLRHEKRRRFALGYTGETFFLAYFETQFAHFAQVYETRVHRRSGSQQQQHLRKILVHIKPRYIAQETANARLEGDFCTHDEAHAVGLFTGLSEAAEAACIAFIRFTEHCYRCAPRRGTSNDRILGKQLRPRVQVVVTMAQGSDGAKREREMRCERLTQKISATVADVGESPPAWRYGKRVQTIHASACICALSFNRWRLPQLVVRRCVSPVDDGAIHSVTVS